MKTLVAIAEQRFANHFGYPSSLTVQAPGRVNLIGEHTDYNGGFVLPCAIDYYTVVSAAPRTDNRLRVVAVDYDQVDEFDVQAPQVRDEERDWVNYVRGLIFCAKARGYPLAGVDIVVTGNVPQGAGLSSSASLEMALALTFKTLFAWPASMLDLALLGQAAENEFVGCQCGIMDQYISAMALDQRALLIDCQTLDARPVALPADTQVLIVNSNVRRGLVDSEYNSRRQQCETAAEQLGVDQLRAVSVAAFAAQDSKLAPLVRRRARHVVTENARVLLAEAAMNGGDLQAMAKLMADSHASMRDDFEITVAPIDQLVALIKSAVGEAGGVRMTGGGFGGCVVALVPKHLVQAVVTQVTQGYFAATGLQADIHICRAVAGAGLVINQT